MRNCRRDVKPAGLSETNLESGQSPAAGGPHSDDPPASPLAFSMEHITGRQIEGGVATEAQRLEREAWEANTLPLSYARSSAAVAEADGVDKYIKETFPLKGRKPGPGALINLRPSADTWSVELTVGQEFRRVGRPRPSGS